MFSNYREMVVGGTYGERLDLAMERMNYYYGRKLALYIIKRAITEELSVEEVLKELWNSWIMRLRASDLKELRDNCLLGDLSTRLQKDIDRQLRDRWITTATHSYIYELLQEVF